MEQIFSTYVSINRIRLEFKGKQQGSIGKMMNMVLIESDWNLKEVKILSVQL